MKCGIIVLGKALVLVTCVSLAACSSSFVKGSEYAKGSGKTLKISSEVWQGYQNYLRKVGSNRPGAFAVALDGTDWGSITCRATICAGSMTYSNEAILHCQVRAPECIIFAKRDEIVVDYEVVD